MDYYLLALYVSLEQELAIRELFAFKGWNFNKCQDENVQRLLKLAETGDETDKIIDWNNVDTLQESATDYGSSHNIQMKSETSSRHEEMVKVKSPNHCNEKRIYEKSLDIDETNESDTFMEFTSTDRTTSSGTLIPDILDTNTALETVSVSDTIAGGKSLVHTENDPEDTESGMLCDKPKIETETDFSTSAESMTSKSNQTQIPQIKLCDSESGSSDRMNKEIADNKTIGKEKSKSNELCYCKDCKCTFRKYKYKKHKQDGKCVIICEYCGKRFTSRFHSNYLSHLKYHIGDRPHKCNECGKTYIEAQTLKIHLRTHSNTRPYICQHCGKQFFSASALTSHSKRMHDENYKFSSCDICGAILSTPGNLNEHKKVVHNDDRPYICSICGKSFKTQKMLEKVHAAVHSEIFPYVCSFANCGKKFKRTDYLANHMRRHNNERKYFCEMCEKAFYSKKELTSHMRVHTGEKPYNCTYCEYRCALRGNLTKHMKTHVS